MVREIINWCDKEQAKAYEEYDEHALKGIARAFRSGFVEGALDGLLISGVVLTAVGLVAMVKPNK